MLRRGNTWLFTKSCFKGEVFVLASHAIFRLVLYLICWLFSHFTCLEDLRYCLAASMLPVIPLGSPASFGYQSPPWRWSVLLVTFRPLARLPLSCLVFSTHHLIQGESQGMRITHAFLACATRMLSYFEWLAVGFLNFDTPRFFTSYSQPVQVISRIQG